MGSKWGGCDSERSRSCTTGRTSSGDDFSLWRCWARICSLQASGCSVAAAATVKTERQSKQGGGAGGGPHLLLDV